jgi:hypothetical protein
LSVLVPLVLHVTHGFAVHEIAAGEESIALGSEL